MRGAALLAAVTALVTLAVTPAQAAPAPAGKVTVLTGRAVAATPGGRVRALTRGGALYSGETVVTYPSSYLRMKFSDGSAVLLRPNTRFRIERYRMSERPAERRGFFRLLKGGFRAVTGLIGKTRRQNYRVRTAVATIGIRGTDYAVRLCDGDCDEYGPGIRDGLYVRLEHNAGVDVCPAAGGDCVVLDEAGEETYIAPDGSSEEEPPYPVFGDMGSPDCE